jgi:hypothetical protein
MGFVRQNVTDPTVKHLLLLEMMARVAKHELKQRYITFSPAIDCRLRATMQEVKLELQEPYKSLTILYIVYCNSDCDRILESNIWTFFNVVKILEFNSQTNYQSKLSLCII